MPVSTESTTRPVRVLSPSDQLAIAAHLQALAATWPAHQRRQLRRYINHNRRTRFNIWAALDISTEVLP